jgi:fumarylacetoacetase
VTLAGPGLDGTHDPKLRSWVDSANDPAQDFPVQNLPLGTFRAEGRGEAIGIAIGDRVLDLRACLDEGLLTGLPDGILQAAREPRLNGLMARPALEVHMLRHRLSHLLRAGSAQVTARAAAERVLLKQADVELLLPSSIGDYTDFYASVFHATNVGRMLRPDNPLLPNYKHVPIGYHGRASSVVVSGTPVRRPQGQTEGAAGGPPSFGPSRSLDYELEVGVFVGAGNALGQAVPIAEAEQQVFGLCLLNDWSARDVQKWEYQPLGPFLAKSFATSIGPWVVMREALAPFRVRAFPRPDGDPEPLPYLSDPADRERGGYDVRLEVRLSSRTMRAAGRAPVVLSRSTLSDLYWTPAQMVAHHTSNGCNLRPGDLLGTGTVSGEARESRGCLLELTWRGSEPIALPGGEARRFLEDGDEVVLSGRCEREGFAPLGFGECRGTIVAAQEG